MNILRKLLLGLVSFLFIVLLFTTAFAVGFIRFSSSPEKVKVTFAKSGIYNNVLPALLKQTKTIQTSAGTIVLTDPAIQKAANKAISPAYIQQNTESVIDGTYKWLDGKSSTPDRPDIYIDLKLARVKLADGISTAIYNHLLSLPACTSAQTKSIAQAINAGQNPGIDATCITPGLVNPGNIAGNVKDGILNGGDLLSKNKGNDVITADDFKSTGSSKSIFQDKLMKAPEAYQQAKMSPIILSILTVLAALGIVFLSSSWPVGLRRAGIGMLVVGIIMMISAYTLNHESRTQIVPRIKMDNVALQVSIRNLATDIIQQIDKNYWFFGGLYTALGVGMIAGGESFRRRAQPKHALSTAKPEPETPKEEPKPAEEPKKSKPRKVKIQ